MKKTLTVFFLVVLFSLVMATVVFAAEPIVLNEENSVLDLTGKNIEGPIIVESGNVTIKGNGTVTSPQKPSDYTGTDVTSEYATIFVKGGNLTIEGGTFISNTGWNTAIHAALYVRDNGTVIVNGGTFEGQGKDFALRVCGEAGDTTVTINGGTFDAQRVTACACCGGTININGGTWTCDSKYNGLSDTLNIYTMESNKLGKINVTGGTFVDFNPTKIYTEGPYPAQEELEPTNAVAEGYEYDSTTGTVACAHNDLEKHEEVPATYEAEGTKEYWVCPTCSKWFTDENGTTEITDKDSVIIPKLVQDEEENTETPDSGKDEDTEVTPDAGTNEDTEVKEETDESPKMGVESTTLTMFVVVAVISLAGIVLIKKVNKR